MAEYIRNVLHFISALRGITDIADPYLLSVAVFNCRGVHMSEAGIDMFGRGRVNEWTEADDIIIEPVLAPLDEPPDTSGQRLADRFWNAFHFAGCPFFTPKGFVIPTS